jgi:polyisoprenoid-binding protein YceI
MKSLLALIALVGVLAVPAATQAGTWNIDASHSNVDFKIRHFFSKVGGSFNDFAGVIHFDPADVSATTAELTIQATSIDTNNEKRDNHLRAEDFFFVEEYPTITFTGSEVVPGDGDSFQLKGMLTMRGVEKPVVMDVEFLGAGPDAWGNTRAGFTATTTINREEWNVSWNNVMDTGSAVLGDDVEITIEIEAVKEKPAEEEGGW